MDTTSENNARFVIDGKKPQYVVYPESIDQVSEALRLVAANELSLVPVGEGGFLHIGGLPRRYDQALSLQRLNNIIDYQPTDMTVTVESGLTLAQLQAVLGEHGQWLPLDPPRPEHVTIGGMIATNLSGPARLSQGTIRDFLIGLKVVTADGTVVKSGGRVVKNVAGYDLMKLYCGSFGTLGVIVEATFKVRPRPEQQRVLAVRYPSATQAMEKVQHLLHTELQPFFIELTNFAPLGEEGETPSGGYLFVGFAGISEEVAYQHSRFLGMAGGDIQPDKDWQEDTFLKLTNTLRDFPVAEDALLRCKVSLLPSYIAGFWQKAEEEGRIREIALRLLAHAGNGILYVRVPRQDGVTQEKLLSFVDWLRILAKQLGGYLIIEEIASELKERVDVWGHIGNVFPLMKRLKETLDPKGILNPGRFVGGI
ncbi:MAG: FAD-binding oxidoreductase [Candidatus Binatia bacterium]